MANKKGQGPLLFINQPFLRPPANKMQEVFRSKQVNFPSINEDNNNEEWKKKQVEKSEHSGDVENMKTANSDLSNKDTSALKPVQRFPTLNRVKPFKEMNVHERLEYLKNFPKALPPVLCVFYTAEQKHLGFLKEYEEDKVTIQFQNNTTQTFSAAEILNVVMIGIRR
ncbi:hypothetical protein HW35_15420 [Bacillus sp. X1(2014)]|jgi:Spore coat protein CotO|nr:hypothetical protein HW35_15420 [Bacillus sp. X1(2014)]